MTRGPSLATRWRPARYARCISKPCLRGAQITPSASSPGRSDPPRRPRAVSLRLAATLALFAALALPLSADQLTLKGRYSEVSGEAKARPTAQRVAALIDEAVPRIAPLVGATDLRPVRAVIYLDRGRF